MGWLFAAAGSWIAAVSAEPVEYFLQKGKDGREFIDNALHKDSVMISKTLAYNWKHAKELLTSKS